MVVVFVEGGEAFETWNLLSFSPGLGSLNSLNHLTSLNHQQQNIALLLYSTLLTIETTYQRILKLCNNGQSLDFDV